MLRIDIFIFVFVFYYILSLRDREKRVEKKENAIDSDYHHVVDEALSKERKIINDATSEADQIIKQSQFLSQSPKAYCKNVKFKCIATFIATYYYFNLNQSRQFS